MDNRAVNEISFWCETTVQVEKTVIVTTVNVEIGAKGDDSRSGNSKPG